MAAIFDVVCAFSAVRPARARQVREPQIAPGLGPVGALAKGRLEGLDGEGPEPGAQQGDARAHQGRCERRIDLALGGRHNVGNAVAAAACARALGFSEERKGTRAMPAPTAPVARVATVKK